MRPDIPSLVASLVNSLIILGIAWRAIKAINRLVSILQDYPPHRHVNGKILFAKGFEPTHIEMLGDNDERGTA